MILHGIFNRPLSRCWNWKPDVHRMTKYPQILIFSTCPKVLINKCLLWMFSVKHPENSYLVQSLESQRWMNTFPPHFSLELVNSLMIWECELRVRETLQGPDLKSLLVAKNQTRQEEHMLKNEAMNAEHMRLKLSSREFTHLCLRPKSQIRNY